MATLTTEDVADLIATTQKDRDKGKWTDLTGDLQEYTAMPNLLKGDKVREGTGQAIQVNIVTDDNGQARWVGLMETDSYNIKDVVATGSAPWRHCTWNFTIGRIEMELNSADEDQIIDLYEIRRATSMISGAKLLETAFWSKPADSTDVKTMWGVDMYIVKNATAGFNGGNPSGFTSGAIFSSTSQARWKNYTDQYTNVTKPDCVFRVRRAMAKTRFKSPINVGQMRDAPLKRAAYAPYSVTSTLETLAEQQNDNLGKDLAAMDGRVTINKIPVQWVPELDSDTQYSIYGIDWSVFVPVFLKGENMKESKPRIHPSQHTAIVVDFDATLNIPCYDRRRLWIVNTA